MTILKIADIDLNTYEEKTLDSTLPLNPLKGDKYSIRIGEFSRNVEFTGREWAIHYKEGDLGKFNKELEALANYLEDPKKKEFNVSI